MPPEQDGLVISQGCDVIGVSNSWLDESHGWSTGMECYRLFRSNGQSRQGGGIAPFGSKGLIAQPYSK